VERVMTIDPFEYVSPYDPVDRTAETERPERDLLVDVRTAILPPPPMSDTPPAYFAQKADQGKPQLSLVLGSLRSALEAVTRVREFGYQKYGSRDGWREVADAKQRYTDALLRHAVAYAAGEQFDAESGKPTLAHLVCDALFLLELDLAGCQICGGSRQVSCPECTNCRPHDKASER